MRNHPGGHTKGKKQSIDAQLKTPGDFGVNYSKDQMSRRMHQPRSQSSATRQLHDHLLEVDDLFHREIEVVLAKYNPPAAAASSESKINLFLFTVFLRRIR